MTRATSQALKYKGQRKKKFSFSFKSEKNEGKTEE